MLSVQAVCLIFSLRILLPSAADTDSGPSSRGRDASKLPNWPPSCSPGFYPRRWRRSGWALGSLSRQEPLMEPPRRSWLPVPSNCPVSLRPLLHTASRSLSPHCALSIQVGCSPRSVQMRLPLAPRRQCSPNYRCKSDPFSQARFYHYPSF